MFYYVVELVQEDTLRSLQELAIALVFYIVVRGNASHNFYGSIIDSALPPAYPCWHLMQNEPSIVNDLFLVILTACAVIMSDFLVGGQLMKEVRRNKLACFMLGLLGE